MTWKKIDGWPYEVSDSGLVRRISTGRILKPEVMKGGYLRVDLRDKGKEYRELVHRLVLFAFVGTPTDPGWECAHLDGNPSNNSIWNLQWKKPIDNHADKHRHGTMPVGEKHWAALLSDEDYATIAAHTESHTQTAEKYGLNRSTVAAIRRRHRLKGDTND